MNDTAGTSSKNPFTILNNTSNDAPGKVIIDLDIEVEDLEEQLDVFRVEENARAAIAEANYKSFLEKQKFRDAPQNDEQLADLTMEVISNIQRNHSQSSLRGESSDRDVDDKNDTSAIQISQ